MEVKTNTFFGKLRPILLLVVLLAAALGAAVSMEKDFFLGMLLQIIMGGVFTAIILITRKEIFMIIGASGSVYFLQFVGGFTASLPGVTFFAASFVLAYCVRRRKPKLTALFLMSLVLGAGFLLSASIFYLIRLHR